MPNPRGKHDQRTLRCLLIAVAAAAVTLFFFTPRVVIWKGLFLPEAWTSPELNRAVHTLRQVEHPWEDVRSRVNQAISWRLLFPLLWHYASLPTGWLLGLPFGGCLLALWLAAWLNHRRLGAWEETFLATTIFAALPWFFTSTGWLAYFDSWLILALLIVSFVRSRAALVATCLLAPWIDERFVLALPVAIVVRAAADRPGERFRADVLGLLAATAPYVAVRALSWLGGDASAGSYVDAFWGEASRVSWSRLMAGLWSGYRAAWIVILCALGWTWKRMGRRGGITLATLVAVSAIGGLFIAGDMSRTMMVLSPVLLLGIWQWSEERPASLRPALRSLCAASLLLPASHVVWSFESPILYLYARLDEWRNPPAFLQASTYLERGRAFLQRGRTAEAARDFDTAIRLDARFTPAYLWRATVRINDGNLDGAASDVESALRLEPDAPTGLFVRANLSRRRGDTESAAADLKRALASAPSDWPQRAEAAEMLREMDGDSH